MIIPDDADLDLTLNFRIEDFSYSIFVRTGKFKCFGCGNKGHLIRNCPTKNVEGEKSNEVVVQGKENDGKEVNVDVQEEGSVVVEYVVDRSVETEAKVVSSQIEQADPIPKNLPTSSVLSVSDRVVYPSECKKGANGEEFQISVMAEEAQLTPEQEQFSFKTQQKRKMKNKVLDAKISKTTTR